MNLGIATIPTELAITNLNKRAMSLFQTLIVISVTNKNTSKTPVVVKNFTLNQMTNANNRNTTFENSRNIGGISLRNSSLLYKVRITRTRLDTDTAFVVVRLV
jgi:hypothetical protein